MIQSFLNCAISLRTINSIVEIFAMYLSDMNMCLILWQELWYWYNAYHNKQTNLLLAVAG